MPLYLAAHTTACLTKQGLKELMRILVSSEEVKVRRCLAGQIGGRMLTEAEAPDQSVLERFFESQRIHCEWIMRIDLEARDGTVAEY